MPTQALETEGWVETETSVETVFSLPSLDVRTATVQYEDEATREALADATDGAIDICPRFFAGTRLVFEPPLPPGVSATAIAPMIRTETRARFRRQLRERGLVDIDRESSQRVRVGGGNRDRVTKYSATIQLNTVGQDLPVACWVTSWTTRQEATVVTGGHPRVRFASYLDLDSEDDHLTKSGESYREEFFSLLRAVE
jgi:hypothetical protein